MAETPKKGNVNVEMPNRLEFGDFKVYKKKSKKKKIIIQLKQILTWATSSQKKSLILDFSPILHSTPPPSAPAPDQALFLGLLSSRLSLKSLEMVDHTISGDLVQIKLSWCH